jgi:hypothetical protein
MTLSTRRKLKSDRPRAPAASSGPAFALSEALRFVIGLTVLPLTAEGDLAKTARSSDRRGAR